MTATEGRKFGLLVGGAFLVLGVLFWRRGNAAGGGIAVALATGLILAGLIAPTRLGPVYRGWMALARAISKVTTPVFMSVIFFLVLTPAGLLVRLFGHRPLASAKDAETHWKIRPAGGTRGEMNHQF